MAWDEEWVAPPGYGDAIQDLSSGRVEEGETRIRQVFERHRSPVWRRRAWFAIGVARLRRREFDPALDALTRAEAAGGPLRDHAALRRGEALVGSGEPRDAAEWLDAAGARSSSPVLADDLAIARALAEASAGDRAHARSLLEEHLASASVRDPGRVLEAAAQIAASGADDAAALDLRRRIYLEFPRSPESAKAEAELAATLPPSRRFRPSDIGAIEQRCRALIDAGEDRAALATWDLALASLPGPLGPGTVVAIAEAAIEARDLPRALRLLDGLPARGLAGGMAARTAWLRARALLALGRQREGLRILGQHAGGRSADAAACRFLLATSLDQSDQDREALEEFAGYARDHADGKNLDAALWRAGWLSFRFRRYAESERLFRRLLDRPNGAPYHPSSRYWLARALEARGLRGVAVDLYRRILREHTRDYYGLRSKERLRSLGAAGPAAADGHGAPPGAAAGPDDPPETLGRPSQEFCAKPRPGRAQDRVLTGCELETVGLFQDAEIEYRAAAEADPDRALALRLAELALRRGDRAGATERLKAAVPDHLSVPTGSLPMRYWELLYPLRERDKIDEMARARRLEPNLVCALILQESAFNPLAVSKAGAMGLMQILPETGREAAAAIDERGFSPARLLEPSTNVRLGTWHFAEILRRCEGRIELALAAYNAGEGRLRTWRRRYDTSDPSVFVEEIPFTETRLYVKRILSHAAMYRELYERRPG